MKMGNTALVDAGSGPVRRGRSDRVSQWDRALPRGQVARVLVLDPGAASRGWTSAALDLDPRLEVIGATASPSEAEILMDRSAPDVVIVDLGVAAEAMLIWLERVLKVAQMPVVIVSRSASGQADAAPGAQAGDRATRRALDLGAALVFARPERPKGPDIAVLQNAVADVVSKRRRAMRKAARRPARQGQLILVGASTGGVNAIEELLPQFSADSPPIVLAQHMPQRFIESFCERLQRMMPLSVHLAEPGMRLEQGGLYVAQAKGQITQVAWKGNSWIITTTPQTEADMFCPSVDRLFHSAVPWAAQVGALILTGIGDDGARGMKALHDGGARTVGQSERSSVVYGMPGAAKALGAIDAEADPDAAGAKLLDLMGART